MKHYLVILLIISAAISCIAQKTELLINSGEIIKKGIELHDNGEYKEAIEQYDTVFEGDTNHVMATYEKALTLTENEQNDEAITLIKKALNFKETDLKYEFYNLLNSAYDGIEDSESALGVINEGLKEYPNSYLLHYNKAITLNLLKRFNESFESLKKALSYNPIHFNSHYAVGEFAANEGDYAKAFFAWSTALLIQPNHPKALETLVALDDLLNISYDEKNNIANLGKDDFSDINDIIKSKVAIDKKYKTGSSINFGFVNQMHALIEMLEENSGNNGWFAKTYLPFYYAIKKEGKFKPFSEYVCVPSGNEKVQKKLDKNLKALKEFQAWYAKKIDLFYGTFEQDGKKLNRTFHENGALSGIGVIENGIEKGSWQYFYSKSGNLVAEGSNDENGQQGEWIFYYSNGNIRKKTEIKDNKENGEFTYYRTDGLLETKGNLINDKEEGIFTFYDVFGCKSVEKTFENGLLNGAYTEFYLNGKPAIEAIFKDGVLDGVFKKYYEDGSIKETSNYKNDKFNGNAIEYYNNGNKLGTYNYTDGVLNGIYKLYYETGELSNEVNYLNGKETGVSKSYYKNGKLSSESNYDEAGKKNGIEYLYNKSNIKTYEQVFKKGEIIEYKFFDKDGTILSKGKKKNNKLYVDNRLPDNTKIAEGNYAVGADGKDGLWKYYTQYGLLESEIEYEKGELKGIYKEYNALGKLIAETKVTKLEPYTEWIVKYYPNGEIASNGWKVNNKFEGKWEFFHPNGNLSETKTFLYNNNNGPIFNYDIEGKLTDKQLYVDDNLTETIIYDTLKNVLQTLNFKNNKPTDFEVKNNFKNKLATYTKLGDWLVGDYKLYHGNGELLGGGNFNNGLKSNEWKYYDNDGLLFYKANYTNGLLNGKQIYYHTVNGNVLSETDYVNNLEDGEHISYYENGNVNVKGKHEEGENMGKWEFYAPDGTLQMVRFYNKDGKVIGYSYNGQDGKLVDMIDLPPDGNATIKAKFANGKASKIYTTKHNEFDGVLKEYYESGQLSENINYKMGYRHGLLQTFFENGTLKEEKNYEYNFLHGPIKEYYPNGQIKLLKNYVYNVLHGEEIYYNEQGKETLKRIFYNDNIIEEVKF